MRLPDIKPYLVTRRLIPENQEAPIHFISAAITPEQYFYRRNHFPYPVISEQSFLLSIGGEVKRPLTFHYQDLLRMPSKEMTVVLECSGNNRGHFRPRVYGEQWEGGAISQGVWRGAPLRDLLKLTGLHAASKEIVFEGHDYGKRTDLEGEFMFARSLPLEKALHPDTLIAYALNGKPIPYKQGYPLRLIVPQWYAMASVKWLRSITVIETHFNGPYQDIDYVYYPAKDSDAGKMPVTTIHVNSIIQQPLNWSVLTTGMHQLYGIAWTGTGFITNVEISIDGGERWEQAAIQKYPGNPYSWTFWSYIWAAPKKGEYTIMSRATDSIGFVQPPEARWNRKGYGYNAYSTVHVKVD
ncbi:sulfite oxidase [Paenibacillus durus]|uniref:Sulfite oxidase n=1 Tax=Paenibacillus durus TaxID=44251 RepID=A0A089HSQ3_PAEDU|nr:sulfite oxidase [Paenibacillus durus]AIQ13775.1 sulfite oxidase [Paenibacillus durus]